MRWRIDFSKEALDFLSRNNIEESLIVNKIKFALQKFDNYRAYIERVDWRGNVYK